MRSWIYPSPIWFKDFNIEKENVEMKNEFLENENHMLFG